MYLPERLFLLGNGRSGTSTLTGVLNCIPEIFILFEVNANVGPDEAKRNREFVSAFREMEPYFGKKDDFSGYDDIARQFAKSGHHYRYFGAKFPSGNLPDSQRNFLKDQKIIWSVRDIRTWLCKNNNVYGWKLLEQDAIPLAVQQVELFLESFFYSKILRLSMEDFILKNSESLALLDGFLEMPVKNQVENWWERIGRYTSDDPKGKLSWWNGHDSSRLRPRKLDTTAELAPHPFWEELLPVFDKYYHGLNASFSPKEVNQDLAMVSALKSKYSATLNELYAHVNSVSFGSGPDGEKGHRSSNQGLFPLKI